MITLDSLNLETMSPSKLGELLVEAKKAYYTTGKPIMDDHTYDTLEEILKKKAPYHRLFSKVGNDNFDTAFPKKKHSFIMGSQNKVTSYEELLKYFQLKGVGAKTQFLVQPKCDGISLEIEFDDGHLVDAITRGDGRVGDLITQNVVLMKQFSATAKDFTGSVRCEIVVTQKDFEKLNQLLPEEEQYSNPRNAASGISQRLDSKYSEFCSLYAVDLLSKEADLNSESQKVSLLKDFGFTPVESIVCQNLEEVEKVYQDFLTHKRDDYPYDIDGLVIKISDLESQSQLGFKNLRPKGQVAYKFPPDTSHTRILEVSWETGPMGTITPVAKVEPIKLSGALITYASLANFELIKEKNINIDDIVTISRRGDVIPHIDSVLTKVTKGHLSAPKTCPSCHTPLVKDNKFLRCPNIQNCPAQKLGVLQLFCKSLDIKGISDKTIQKFYEVGKLSLPGDFYNLKLSDFLTIEGLGEKSGRNILKQIDDKRELTLLQIFNSAQIPHFSRKRVKQVISLGFDTPQKILDLSVSDLSSLPGFKETLSKKIVDGISARLPVINSILENVSLKDQNLSSQKLKDLSFVITGSLSQPRKDFEKLIEDNGGLLRSSISKDTSYLISNDTTSSSSKLSKAKSLNVPIISEDKLLEMIGQKKNKVGESNQETQASLFT